MYNRYIPQPDGSFQRKRVQEPHQRPQTVPKPDTTAREKEAASCPAKNQPAQRHPQNSAGSGNLSSFFRQFLPGDFETGDLIVVLLLLLMAGDCQENQNTALLTMALYFLM